MIKKIFVYFLILSTVHTYASIVQPAGCPLVCSSTGATFCNINAGSLCVTGNLQVGGDVTICGRVNVTHAYGYFFDPNFSVLLNTSTPTKIPLTTPGVGAVVNVAHPNATDIVVQIPGVYLITYRIEPTTALSITSDIEMRQNGTTVPGSVFSLAAAISNIEVSGISIITANTGDVITVVITALLADTTFAGKSSFVIEKIA